MTSIVFVLVSHPDAAAAKLLARALVEGGLAAAVNILPGANSIYRWRDRIEEAEETVMIVKTSASCMEQVSALIRMNHPYECPCIAALPVTEGEPAYLEWIARSCAR